MPEEITSLIENNPELFQYVVMGFFILVGLVLCFAGFRTFRMFATLIAMVIVGGVAAWGGSLVLDKFYILVLLALLGFFMGAIFRKPFEHGATVLYGAMVGEIVAVIAVMVLAFIGIVDNPFDTSELKELPLYYAGAALGFAVLGGALIFKFRRPITIFVTGFNGALMLCVGLIRLLGHLEILEYTFGDGLSVVVDASPYILPGIIVGLTVLGILFQTANSKSKVIEDKNVDAADMGIGERII